jgi:hypothetical protein
LTSYCTSRAPGGYFIFTVGTAAWNEGGFRKKVTSLEVTGRWQLVEVTKPYAPMPHSTSEGAFLTRCYVYRVS